MLTNQEVTRNPTGAAESSMIRRQLERILASRHFRDAPSQAGFVRFVVEQALAGREGELKEHTIGIEVFHRGPSYDPASDAIVRVQAGLVRKKLRQFYAEAADEDQVLIEIPKGHYVPRFQARTETRARPGAGEAGSPARRFSVRLWIMAAGLTTASFWGGVQWSSYRESEHRVSPEIGAEPSLDAAFEPIWRSFFTGEAGTTLAYGTAQFFNADGVYIRDVGVNSPEDVDRSPFLQAVKGFLRKPLRPVEIYTGIGEANGLAALSKFFARAGRNLRLVRSRVLHWQDLRRDNVIFLTSARFGTLADQLGFAPKFSIDVDRVGSAVVNRTPREGEQTFYRLEMRGADGAGYGLISLLPGKEPGRKVLILSGLHTWGTQAAAEYVVSMEHMTNLRSRLTAQRRSMPESFQVLLRVEIRDNYPTEITYVTHAPIETLQPGR